MDVPRLQVLEQTVDEVLVFLGADFGFEEQIVDVPFHSALGAVSAAS